MEVIADEALSDLCAQVVRVIKQPIGQASLLLDHGCIADVVENVASIQEESAEMWCQAVVDDLGEATEQTVLICGLHCSYISSPSLRKIGRLQMYPSN